VLRIFQEYAAGKSAQAIAKQLNTEELPGPAGAGWGPSTIHGSAKRRNGILNNELYAGRLVWNRQRFIKDPDTGKRVSRPNPESEWVTTEVPELRIVEADLWDRVKQRQGETRKIRGQTIGNYLTDARRARYLFSRLVRCGRCGGGYSMISKDLLGCSTARNKGTCDNRLNIRRDSLEASALNGLREHLMEPDLFAEFCAAFTQCINEARMSVTGAIAQRKAELATIERSIRTIIEAIKDGMYARSMKGEMHKLETRKAELAAWLEKTEEPPALVHPNMAAVYHRKVDELVAALNKNDARNEASEILRSLIDAIILTPNDTGKDLSIVLRGDLAGILAVATGQKQKNRRLWGRRGFRTCIASIVGCGDRI
jgi:site-specific DNA recombinase